MSNATLQTIHSHLVKEQQYGGYGAAKQAQKDITSVYQKIAHAIHTSPGNIALTQGNSDGWTRIIHSMDWSQGGRILVANNEWGGNLGTLMQLHTQFGVKIEAIPSHADGMVDIDALNSQLQAPTNLVALTWFSSNSPLIQPAEAIGQVCNHYKTPLLIDAAQAMGQ